MTQENVFGSNDSLGTTTVVGDLNQDGSIDSTEVVVQSMDKSILKSLGITVAQFIADKSIVKNTIKALFDDEDGNFGAAASKKAMQAIGLLSTAKNLSREQSSIINFNNCAENINRVGSILNLNSTDVMDLINHLDILLQKKDILSQPAFKNLLSKMK